MEWRSVVGFPSYEVSEYGGVRSVPREIVMRNGQTRRLRGRTITPIIAKTGHMTVHLYEDSLLSVESVHRLVLGAFDRQATEGEVCRHLDGKPGNNHFSNLKWGTYSENAYDRVKHGNHLARNRTHCPRGHLLDGDNLVGSELKRGFRKCKSCHRARSYCAHRGLLNDDDMQRVSDEKYAQITERRTHDNQR